MTERRSFLALAGAAVVGGLASLAARAGAAVQPDPVPVTGTRYFWNCPVCGSTMQLTAQIDLVSAAPLPTPAPTATPLPTLSSIDDEGFTYFGLWTAYPRTAQFPKYGIGDHASVSPGASFGILFTGTEVRLIAAKAPYHGIAEVSLDGGPAVDVDYYNATRIEQAQTWSSGPIPPGAHRVQVRVSGRKNPASTDYAIAADRIDVVNGTIIPALAA